MKLGTRSDLCHFKVTTAQHRLPRRHGNARAARLAASAATQASGRGGGDALSLLSLVPEPRLILGRGLDHRVALKVGRQARSRGGVWDAGGLRRGRCCVAAGGSGKRWRAGPHPAAARWAPPPRTPLPLPGVRAPQRALPCRQRGSAAGPARSTELHAQAQRSGSGLLLCLGEGFEADV